MECSLQEESRRDLRDALQRKKVNFAHDKETNEVFRTIGRARER